VSLNQLLAELRDLLGSDDVESVYLPPRPADIEHTLADLARARADLGYQPSVPLREGLERTIHHIIEEESQGVWLGC
jgi:nucleoside-diphosphate-sugar epimerase